MNKALTVVAALLALAASATQYSKLSVITSAKRRGRWQELKAFIEYADLKDEWDCCQYLHDGCPQFAAVTNALVAQGVATAEDVLFILTNSVDRAVDDSHLRRVYDTDMMTSSGRSRWHGRKIREIVDTDTMTRVTVYEDGERFVDRAKIVGAKPAKLPAPVMTNGIPLRLANARLRQRANSVAVSNVTSTVKADMQRPAK